MKDNGIKDKLQDFIYDNLDYIMIGSVLLVTVLIINWKMGCLFDTADMDYAKEIVETPASDKKVNNEKKKDGTVVDVAEKTKDEGKDKNDEDKEKKKEEAKEKTEKDKVKVISFSIPKGALSNDVAKILEEVGVVKDQKDFLKYVHDSGMETKLKYGDYEISNDSDYDTIIEILSK